LCLRLLLTLTGCCRLLCFGLKLDFHAHKQKCANKSRLPHDHVRGHSCPLENVVE
jgi:hypothetical protein